MGALIEMEDGLKKVISTYWFLFFIGALVVALDQLTKAVVRTNLALGQTWMPLEWLAPYARFIHWQNTGVAFGMFQGMGVVFAVLAAVVSVGLVIVYPRMHQGSWLVRLAMGMMLGGAIGNLIDRIFNNGYVTDFISVGSFAVFNIADSGITVGVGLLVLGMYLLERKEKAAQKAEAAVAAAQEAKDEAGR